METGQTPTRRPADRSDDEAQLRHLLDDWQLAVREKDTATILGMYAPDVVRFDLLPPIAVEGADACASNLDRCFRSIEGLVDFELHDARVVAATEIAFAHGFLRAGGRRLNGRGWSDWFRWSATFRRIEGGWRIAHEHVSVPYDMATGKALLNLQPHGVPTH